MIVVAGHLTTNPNARDAAIAAIGECVTATQAEAGCIDYRFSADLEDPNRLNMVEIWESEAAMDAHMASPHLAALIGKMGDFIGGSVEITRYDVSGSSKLF